MTDERTELVTCSVCLERKPKKQTAGIKLGGTQWKYTCTDCILSHGADHMFAPVGKAIKGAMATAAIGIEPREDGEG